MGLAQLLRTALVPGAGIPADTPPAVPARRRAAYELSAVNVPFIPGTSVPITEGWRIMSTAGYVPSVYRARQMTVDTVSELPVVSMRDRRPAQNQPAIVLHPNDEQTPQEFVAETVMAMVNDGVAYWKLSGWDDFGHPTSAQVAQSPEVMARWSIPERPTGRRHRLYFHGDGAGQYRPLGSSLFPDLAVIPLNRSANDLTGTGPMQSPRLRGLIAEMAYSQNYFEQAADPGGTLIHPGDLTQDEAQDLLEQWVAEKLGYRGTSVLSGGLTYKMEGFSPEQSQWVETHLTGVLDAAHLFGMPPAFLGYNSPGGSLTYQNLSDVWEDWWRGTLRPSYVKRITAAWSRLVPRGQAVTMNPNLLVRGDSKARYEVYALALTNGIMDVAEVRELEGLPVDAGAPAMTTPEGVR